MDKPTDLRYLYDQLGLSLEARQLIERVRGADPSRGPRRGSRNVTVKFASQKMGLTLYADSHRKDLPFLYELEYDREVVEYYDNPLPLEIPLKRQNGQLGSYQMFPQVFVIRTDSAGWEDYRTEKALSAMAEKSDRYFKDAEERWHCVPAEAYAAQFGLYYQLRSSAELKPDFQRNFDYLADYFGKDCPEPDPEVEKRVKELVNLNCGMTLEVLHEQFDMESRDSINVLIALSRVYVDLWAAPLAVPSRVHVFPSVDVARAFGMAEERERRVHSEPPSHALCLLTGSQFLWDGVSWTIVNQGQATTSLLSSKGDLIELPTDKLESLARSGRIRAVPDVAIENRAQEAMKRWLAASPDEQLVALERLKIVARVLEGEKWTGTSPSPRTVRSWVAAYRRAGEQYGYRYAHVGLVSRHQKRGNRQRKLPSDIVLVMDEVIENHFETPDRKHLTAVYGELLRVCEERGLSGAPSYKTFSKAVKQRSKHGQKKSREGEKAAYESEPQVKYLVLEHLTPPHGDRPFEIGHIDHTELDIELVHSRTGKNMGRPWATFLVDAYSRRILAIFLTYDPPSYRSCMMVLRECVRRHGRLPQIVVVDGGREFHSAYFEKVLARYGCTVKTRPAGKPKFGSVGERLFGTVHTEFIHNLAGNTQSTKNVRQLTPEINPRLRAKWTLPRLFPQVCKWGYEVYDNIEHPKLGESPREAFERGMAEGGMRLHKLIPYDEDFLMATLPTTPKGTALVQPGRGIKVNGIYYWSKVFKQVGVEGHQVHVRYDPWDISIAYAYAGDKWVKCVSEYAAELRGRSEREIELLSAEIRKQKRDHEAKREINAKTLAQFRAEAEAEPALEAQRAADEERDNALSAIDNTGARPDKQSTRQAVGDNEGRTDDADDISEDEVDEDEFDDDADAWTTEDVGFYCSY